MGVTGAVESQAGYKAADCLKATLTAQLKAKVVPAHAQGGLLMAIRLCERFRTHSGGSQAELLVLLKEVKKLFNPDIPVQEQAPKEAQSPSPVSGPSARGGGPDGPDAETRSVAGSAGRESSVDSGMPPMLIEARAHAKGSAFGKIARLQDERARQDDAAARAARAQRQADMRAALQAQLHGAALRRQAEREERCRDGVALSHQIAQFQTEQQERRQKQREDGEALKKVYEGQVLEAQKRAQAEREARAREASLFRQEVELEQRLEVQAKVEKAAADVEAREVMVAANERRIAERAADAERRRAEDREYGRRYADMLRGWEEQRAASAAAFAAKSKLAYEAAGGKALGQRMEQQARLDEERAEREAAERERREDAERERRQEERRAREAATLLVLNRQVAERKRLEWEERAAEARAGDALAARRKTETAEARRARSAERARKRTELAEKEAAMQRETRARFDAANDALGLRDMEVHGAVLAGSKPAFNYFSGRPVTGRVAARA